MQICQHCLKGPNVVVEVNIVAVVVGVAAVVVTVVAGVGDGGRVDGVIVATDTLFTSFSRAIKNHAVAAVADDDGGGEVVGACAMFTNSSRVVKDQAGVVTGGVTGGVIAVIVAHHEFIDQRVFQRNSQAVHGHGTSNGLMIFLIINTYFVSIHFMVIQTVVIHLQHLIGWSIEIWPLSLFLSLCL